MEMLKEMNGTDAQQKMQLAEDKVESLKEVIKKLQMTKKFLHLNAVEVKASIHSNISRLLETLRSREVLLLNQVDVILQTKEDGLRCQEDELNQAIGRLSNCLSLMDGGAALNTELDDILCRTDALGKHPVESPHISFRADVARLRQAVHEFGRVDSKGLPLEAFASPNVHSSSLPKPFEDYEDDDQHVFYKTIREIHEKKHGKSIVFNIPKLSTDIPSWVSPVHVPGDKGIRSPFGSHNQAEFGSKLRSITIASERKKPTTACSVSQWMQEIKMEEEGDELMTSQVSSRYGNKGMVTSASASCLLSGSRPESQKSQSTKVGNIHQLSRNSELIEGASEERPWMNNFPFLSPQLQDWLFDGESRLPKIKTDAQVKPVAFEPFVFKPSVDMALKENFLDNYMKRLAALPLSAWLAPSVESAKLELEMGSSLLDDYTKRLAALPWLISCRGVLKETVCESESEKSCGILENHTKNIANLAWLASDETKESVGSCKMAMLNSKPDFQVPNMEPYAKTSLLSWLLTKDEKPEPEKQTFSSNILKISQLPTSHWVLSHQETEETSPTLLPQYCNDDIQNQSEESCVQNEDSSEPIVKEVEKADVSGIVDYYNALNSFSIDYWLSSTPADNSTY